MELRGRNFDRAIILGLAGEPSEDDDWGEKHLAWRRVDYTLVGSPRLLAKIKALCPSSVNGSPTLSLPMISLARAGNAC